MPKKEFKSAASHLDKFFSDTDAPQTASSNPFADVKPGLGFPETPPKAQQKQYCRINLRLETNLKEYLNDASWQARKSVTQYIIDLIQADRDTRDT